MNKSDIKWMKRRLQALRNKNWLGASYDRYSWAELRGYLRLREQGKVCGDKELVNSLVRDILFEKSKLDRDDFVALLDKRLQKLGDTRGDQVWMEMKMLEHCIDGSKGK